MADPSPRSLGALLARFERRARGATTEVEPECEHCGDRGWIVDGESGSEVARRCGCRDKTLAPRLLAAAGIPPRFRDKSLANFDTSFGAARERTERLKAHRAAERYVDAFVTERGGFLETGLLFIGPPGVGKTHLAAAVLTRLIERYRVRGLFVDFTSLLHEIRATFDSRTAASQAGVLHPITEAEVAVIDDLGAQKSSDWVSEILYLILNTRYANRLPTIFTTNYRLEPARRTAREAPSMVPGPEEQDGGDFDREAASAFGTEAPRVGFTSERHDQTDAPELLAANRLPPALVSRLYEMAEAVVIEAGDYRKEKLDRRTP